jgi:4-aminobutyrate aminotransferase
MAKALASGLPLGAVVARTELMDWEGGSHASTFGGNPLSCTAAMAVIDAIKEEKLLENAEKQGEYILKRLRELKGQSEIIGDVRGKGLMIGVEIVEDKKTKKADKKKTEEIMVRSWKQGVAVITCGVSTLRIAPPLNITRELVNSGLAIVEDVISDVEKD